MSLPVTQNILNCFGDLITLDGCDNAPSTSGRTMGELGITKHELDQYINKEYQSGSELFQVKKTYCIALLANQVHAHLQSKYKTKTLIDSKRTGFILDNKESQPSITNQWVGQEFNLKNNTSFLEFFISEISLFTNYTGDIEIRICDLKSGNILKDEAGNDFVFTIASVAGENSTVYPQIKIQSPKKELDLAIVYNATGITPYKVSTISEGCLSCDPCSRTKYSEVRGITIPNGSAKIKNSISYQNYTGGMSIIYSINCSPEKWLCSISNLIKIPLMNKIASELMAYALYNSDQMNPKTLGLFNAENIQKRLDKYEFDYRESFDYILENIVVPKDSVCFNCEKRILRGVTIP